MLLYLARHGQTNYNLTGKFQSGSDYWLNETGITQAHMLGKRLQGLNITNIFSSDLKRVTQTANIINTYISANLNIREELREINMGKWEGLSIEEIKKRYKDFFEKWSTHKEDFAYPEGESGKDVYERVYPLFKEILSRKFESTLIVTSGGVIKTLLSKFLNTGFEERFKIETDNCGLSIVEFDHTAEKFIVKLINDISHLKMNIFNPEESHA